MVSTCDVFYNISSSYEWKLFSKQSVIFLFVIVARFTTLYVMDRVIFCTSVKDLSSDFVKHHVLEPIIL
jgi:hypothetical protein